MTIYLFQMITEIEIGKLEALVKEYPAKLEDFVFDEEIEKIKENPTRYQNLYTRVIRSLHKRRVNFDQTLIGFYKIS